MAGLPQDLHEKRLRLMGAVRRGAFESYMRHGRVPDLYGRLAAAVSEAKTLDSKISPPAREAGRPAGRPTTHYVWRTAGDNRVRDTHAALDGQILAWDDRSDHGHPGTQPNCRCWPEPYYGDPSVSDSTLLLSRNRQFNTSGGKLWASVETLTRPDGSLAASAIVASDGTKVHSTFVGTNTVQVVTLPDTATLRVERDGDFRRMSLGVDNTLPLQVAWLGRAIFPRLSTLPLGPAPVASIPMARLPNDQSPLDGVIAPAAIMVRAAAALYNMLVAAPAASGAGAFDLPAMAFGAWDYASNGRDVAPILTGTLTREQVAQFCKRLPEVQAWTDQAAQLYRPDRWRLGPQGFGTKVHSWVAERVRAIQASGAGDDLRAEYSIDPDRNDYPAVYGRSGTLRLDVLEYRPTSGLACVYDIKTGNAELTPSRILQIASMVNRHFGLVQFIVIEVKPGD